MHSVIVSSALCAFFIISLVAGGNVPMKDCGKFRQYQTAEYGKNSFEQNPAFWSNLRAAGGLIPIVTVLTTSPKCSFLALYHVNVTWYFSLNSYTRMSSCRHYYLKPHSFTTICWVWLLFYTVWLLICFLQHRVSWGKSALSNTRPGS